MSAQTTRSSVLLVPTGYWELGPQEPVKTLVRLQSQKGQPPPERRGRLHQLPSGFSLSDSSGSSRRSGSSEVF
jgi:hypothetical protein